MFRPSLFVCFLFACGAPGLSTTGGLVELGPDSGSTSETVTSSTTSSIPGSSSGDFGGSSGSTSEVGTSTGSSSDSSTGSSGSSSTTGVIPFCGDGMLDEGEECDNGPANADTAACTSTCKTATCGDGLVLEGEEKCDDGNEDESDECLMNCTAASCGDGFVQMSNDEHCDDGNPAEDDGCLSMCKKARSCKEIHELAPSAPSGVYTITEGTDFQVYCDMDSDGGGWTLIGRFANVDTPNWMNNTGEWWYTRTATAGAPTVRHENLDAFSSAFHRVAADEFKIARTDKPTDEHLLMTTGSCLAGQTFRQHITQYGNFQNGVEWAMNQVRGTCDVELGGDWETTNGFQYANCDGEIGGAKTISFWTDWGSFGGSVMLIGSAGGACKDADHGLGITDAAAANFDPGGSGTQEDDFGLDGFDHKNHDADYALNLFVR